MPPPSPKRFRLRLSLSLLFISSAYASILTLAPTLALPTACSSTSTSTTFVIDAGTCGRGDAEPPPVQACLDTVAALAHASERCGADYQTAYDDILRQIAGSDCNTITSIRDETSLCLDCVPSLSTLSCDDVNAPHLPAACQQQLQQPPPAP